MGYDWNNVEPVEVTYCPGPRQTWTPGFWWQPQPGAAWLKLDDDYALLYAVTLEDGERLAKVE